MSEQKMKLTAEEKTHERKIGVTYSKLLLFILIVVFFLATCVCVIFLSRAIRNEAGNAIVGLWTTAVSLSLRMNMKNIPNCKISVRVNQ
ncbi:MAG: hypothetical protein ABFC73_14765 [Clostridiaceae bacterium]